MQRLSLFSLVSHIWSPLSKFLAFGSIFSVWSNIASSLDFCHLPKAVYLKAGGAWQLFFSFACKVSVKSLTHMSPKRKCMDCERKEENLERSQRGAGKSTQTPHKIVPGEMGLGNILQEDLKASVILPLHKACNSVCSDCQPQTFLSASVFK